MRSTRSLCVAAVAVVTLLGAAAQAAEVPVADLLKQVPAQDAAAAAEISARLVESGPDGVKLIISKILEPGKAEDDASKQLDVKARYALHGLAIYVSRPQAEAERKMLVEVLDAHLKGRMPASIKGFLIRQLQLCGGEESVEAIAQFLLADPAMSDYAAQALVAIDGPAAVAALRDALPKAKGPNRLTIVQALGVLRDASSTPALLKDAASDSRDLRLAALFALGNIGDPSATDALLKASTPEAPYERAKATDALFLLARRLVAADKKADAEKIYRHLWTERKDEQQVRCGALRGLVAALGEKATDDLMGALKDPSPDVRAVAASIAIAIPGDDMTRRLVAALDGAAPDARADTLGQLGRRGDRIALPAALNAMKDGDANVRKTAIRAVATIGRDDAVGPLIEVLGSQDRGDRQQASKCLIQLSGDKATAAMVVALKVTAPGVRRELLAVLGARGAKDHVDAILACTKDEDGGVRTAAIDALGVIAHEKSLQPLLELLLATQSGGERNAAERAADSICKRGNADKCADALLAAVANAEVPARCALLRILGGTGSKRGLEPLRSAVKDAKPEVQEAATRALARWPDATPTDDLIAIAKDAKDAKLRVLALRGYIDLVKLPNKRANRETLDMYTAAMAIAERPDEKKLILGAVDDIPNMRGLVLAQKCLADEKVRPEAENAIIRLADRLHRIQDDEARKKIADALQAVITSTADGRRKKDAQRNYDRWYKPKKK